MTKILRLLIAILCSVLVLGGVLSGCGKKGDPRPSGSAPPKAIADLKASLADYGVVLRWTIPEAKGGIEKYRIERSELLAKGATCPECPVEYAVVADLSANDPKLAKEGANVAIYLDSGIKAGYLYTYRVVACDSSGLCSQASNISEIVIGPDYPRGKEGPGKK
ncbi:MAG TPA: hypothetical protein VF343_04225 [Syntrophales bacterium]